MSFIPLLPSERQDQEEVKVFKMQFLPGVDRKAAMGITHLSSSILAATRPSELVQQHVDNAPPDEQQLYLHCLASHVFFQAGSVDYPSRHKDYMLQIFCTILQRPDFDPNYAYGMFLADNVVILLDAPPEFLNAFLGVSTPMERSPATPFRMDMRHACGRHTMAGLSRMIHPRKQDIMDGLQATAIGLVR